MSSNDIPKKSLGQHWLNDLASLQAMCDAAGIGPSDTVLEIGPGQGALTRLLVEQAKKVVAIEKDESLAADLPASISSDKLEVVAGDILNFNFSGLPAGYKLAANILYYLTSNLIRALSETSNPPVVAALLVQKEVAERLAASPGQMSILAVTAQFYWQVDLDRVVQAELFEPPPKVDSQIVKLTRRDTPLFAVDEKEFFRLVKAGFSQKRKTLENSLSGGLAVSKAETRELLSQAGVAPTSRAQTLSLEEWHELYKISNNFVQKIN